MKNKTVAVVLALFLGGLGAHKFYLEKAGQGLLYVLFCWTFIPAILGLLEALNYLSMSQHLFDEKYNKGKVANKAVIATSGDAGKCPFCKEDIKLDASICKHCGSKLVSHHDAFMEEGRKLRDAKSNKTALIILLALFGFGTFVTFMSLLL